MGMELGSAASVLQPRTVGWLGWWVSSATTVVSAAAGAVPQPPGIWGQLGLSSAELPASSTYSLSDSYAAGNAAGSSGDDSTCTGAAEYSAE